MENICYVELELYGFNISSQRGRSYLAVCQKYCCTRIPTQNLGNINQVFVLVEFKDYNLLLGCVYIPPNSHVNFFSEFCELVENINYRRF